MALLLLSILDRKHYIHIIDTAEMLLLHAVKVANDGSCKTAKAGKKRRKMKRVQFMMVVPHVRL